MNIFKDFFKDFDYKKILYQLGFRRRDAVIDDALLWHNIIYGSYIALLTGSIALIILLLSLTGQQIGSFQLHEQFYTYALLLGCSVMLALTGHLYRKNKVRNIHILELVLMLYYLSVLVFGLIKSLRTYDSGDHMMAFTTTCVLIFGFFEIRPLVVLLISSADALILQFLMIRESPDHFRILSLVTFCVCILFVSVSRYILAVHNVNNTVKIQNQADELRQINQSLRQISFRDSLTGLYNRYSLRRNFDSYAGQNLVVMMLDVDDFKGFNDNYGHDTGDFILRSIAHILHYHGSRTDCYRYGGDEFLLISSNNEDEFLVKLDSIEKDLQRIHLKGSSQSPTISGGYVYGECSGPDDLRTMIRNADQLLYDSKHNGKKRICGEKYIRT